MGFVWRFVSEPVHLGVPRLGVCFLGITIWLFSKFVWEFSAGSTRGSIGGLSGSLTMGLPRVCIGVHLGVPRLGVCFLGFTIWHFSKFVWKFSAVSTKGSIGGLSGFLTMGLPRVCIGVCLGVSLWICLWACLWGLSRICLGIHQGVCLNACQGTRLGISLGVHLG